MLAFLNILNYKVLNAYQILSRLVIATLYFVYNPKRQNCITLIPQIQAKTQNNGLINPKMM